MSASQDNLLNQEVIEAQGEDLLDQSVDSGEDSLEDMVVGYERVFGPSSQGSRKLVSMVSRIPDKSFLVRQFMFKTMIKTEPKAQSAKTKLHRHQSKCKILRQNPILSDTLIYIK